MVSQLNCGLFASDQQAGLSISGERTPVHNPAADIALHAGQSRCLLGLCRLDVAAPSQRHLGCLDDARRILRRRFYRTGRNFRGSGAMSPQKATRCSGYQSVKVGNYSTFPARVAALPWSQSRRIGPLSGHI